MTVRGGRFRSRDHNRQGVTLTCSECGRDVAPIEPIVIFQDSAYRRRQRWRPHVCLTCFPGVPEEWITDCEHCGRRIAPMSSRRRYCSTRCANDAYIARRKVKRRTPWSSRCQTCGDLFYCHRRDAAHCSNACRQRAYRRRRAGVQ